MRWRQRVPAIDVIFALGVGAFSWFGAQASRWQENPDPVPMRPGGGPMWGPGAAPPGPPRIEWTDHEVWWLPLPVVVVIMAALVVRRRWPRAAFVVEITAVAVFLAIGGPYGPVLVGPALGVHAMALTLPVRQWAPWAALLVPMLLAGFWSEPWFGLFDPRAYAALVFGLTLIMLPAMIGLLRRSRRENERAHREQELRRHGFEERLRIAREVHDVVGHSLSVINLQAGVALHVLDRRPEQIASALQAIKNTSKDALAELRSTLEVYRDPDSPRSPQVGLARLDDLVGTLQAAGRRVTLSNERPAGVRVPAAVDQAAFRIIQEALTNVVRHTTEAAVTVQISVVDDRLVASVAADREAPATIVEGSGITGMRERAWSVGGDVEVSVAGGAGVLVRARLPLTASETQS